MIWPGGAIIKVGPLRPKIKEVKGMIGTKNF